jgi:glutaredoxin 3
MTQIDVWIKVNIGVIQHFLLFSPKRKILIKTTVYMYPNGSSMARVKVYSTGICPICDKTKNLLVKWGIPYEELRVDTDMTARQEFSQITNGARTVPQITIDGEWIGSFSELTELHMDDKLDGLMS